MFLQKCNDSTASKMMRIMLGRPSWPAKPHKYKDSKSLRRQILKKIRGPEMSFLEPLFLETYYQ